MMQQAILAEYEKIVGKDDPVPSGALVNRWVKRN
jgi:hypothetical protein